jgi:predicted small metal-binding protein
VFGAHSGEYREAYRRSPIAKEDIAMRALDCTDPSHGNMHITAQDDDDLTRQVEQHIADSHPEMTTDQARTIVAEGAYDE